MEKYKDFINNYSDKIIFYQNFLDNSSTCIYDFDRRGTLIFQNFYNEEMIKNYNFKSVNSLNLKEIHVTDLLEKNSDCYHMLTRALHKKIKLNKMKDFLINKLNFLSNISIKNKNFDQNKLQSVKIVVHCKRKCFKGFSLFITVDPFK